jgi:hypothetical protein
MVGGIGSGIADAPYFRRRPIYSRKAMPPFGSDCTSRHSATTNSVRRQTRTRKNTKLREHCQVEIDCDCPFALLPVVRCRLAVEALY